MSKVSNKFTDFNALNAMYVKDVKNSVCGFYTTLHTEYCYSSHSILCNLYTGPLAPARREGYSIWAYKGDCRQDAQPIPNS